MGWRDIYTENIRMVSLISVLKWWELFNGEVLNPRDNCSVTHFRISIQLFYSGRAYLLPEE